MLQKSVFLLPLLLAGGFLGFGAWPDSLTPALKPPSAEFSPQSFLLAVENRLGKMDAAQLLQRALVELGEERVRWLKTKIRQTMSFGDTTCVAEGCLQRGPDQCARLEMDLRTNGMGSRLLIVSDGDVLAQERTVGQEPPIVSCEKLPPSSGDARARNIFLADKNCGGPLALLQQLQTRLRNLRRHTGLLQGQAVVLLTGELSQEAIPGSNLPTNMASSCRVYLDASTLWPQRVEWWGQDRSHPPRCVLQIEYYAQQLNLPLTAEECVSVFSYDPPAHATSGLKETSTSP